MKKKTVGVIGSINVDLLLNVKDLPGPGHTVHGQGGTMSPGGKGANQALAAARQGAGVLLIGAVGQDPHAEIALSLLADANVDLGHVKQVEEATGLAVVTVDQYGENNIVVIAGANSTVSREAVDSAMPLLRRCSLVVLQGEIPVVTVDHAMEMLTKSGTRIVLNLAPVIGIRPESIRKADPLIVNEHEAVQALELLGIGTPAQRSDLESTGEELCRALLKSGVASAIVTLGSRGAVVGDANGFHRLPAVRVSVADTTGAGDALVGAAAAGLANGLALLDACSLGMRVAEASVQTLGAQTSYPWA